jgi:hypothetical protein
LISRVSPSIWQNMRISHYSIIRKLEADIALRAPERSNPTRRLTETKTAESAGFEGEPELGRVNLQVSRIRVFIRILCALCTSFVRTEVGLIPTLRASFGVAISLLLWHEDNMYEYVCNTSTKRKRVRIFEINRLTRLRFVPVFERHFRLRLQMR